MSSGGAFGGSRTAKPKPPEKGVFPLDHFGDCKAVQVEYMECLKKFSSDASACQDVAKRYLECRMSKSLMAPQDLKELGFTEQPSSSADRAPKEERVWEAKGFIAGTRRHTPRDA